MRLLVVTPRYPIPVTEGHSLRIRHQLGNFNQNCNFDLVCEAAAEPRELHGNPAKEIGPACRSVIFVPYERPAEPPRLGGPAAKVRNVLFPAALSPGYARKPAMTAEILRRMESREYDLTLFSGFSTFLHVAANVVPTPYVVDMIDSYSLYCRNEFRKPGPPGRRFKALVDYIWAVRYEQRHCSKARNLVLITPADQRSVQRHCPHSRTWSLPNGVDCDFFRDGGDPPASRTLLFTGVMDYTPNSESMLYFIREVLPIVRAELPDTELTVAGKNPSAALLEAARAVAGVTVTGYVEDIRPYFRQAAVYVAPMISGAGLKNKILEAWAMGKPVVATSIAGSGLEIEEGTNILIADGPENFSRKIIDIFKDAALRAKLAAGARRSAVDRYSWNRLSTELLEILEGVAEES